jgi:TolB protein
MAHLTIDISQGEDKPYPVAVVPFSSPDLPTSDLPQGFTDVILNDLGGSGRFSVLSLSHLPESPHQKEDIHLDKWHRQASDFDYVVVGQIKANGGNFDVNYSVVSLLTGDTLYGQRFSHLSLSQLRGLAHFISDKVYQTITGDRGYFSTRFAYVAVEGETSDTPVYRLVISDADGYHPQVLLKQTDNPIASPAWSPDGKTLAYVSYVGNRMAVYTIALANGERKVIANFQGINSAPAFSPDGKFLAMALSLGKSAQTNLYLYDLASHHLRQLTHLGTNTSPAFSPDGQSLVFNSDRSGNPQIYRLKLEDLSVHEVSHQGVQNFSPVFLGQDNRTLACMHQEVGGGPINIAILNVDTGEMKTLTRGSLDKSPSPSPNGKMILYSNFDQDRGILSEVSVNGKVHLNLPAVSGSVQSPAWSPFLT